MSPVEVLDKENKIRLKYSWDEMKAQFREIARLILVVEDRVQKEGRVNANELTTLASNHKLSALGHEVLAEMVRQSDRILILEEGEDIILTPNPEFIPEDFQEEEEDTGIRDILSGPVLSRTTTKKKIEYKGKS